MRKISQIILAFNFQNLAYEVLQPLAYGLAKQTNDIMLWLTLAKSKLEKLK